jgi:hypothetical protein
MASDDDVYRAAKRQVQALRAFYVHLATYLVVNLALFLIDAVTSPGYWWFYWPLLGWGIAVLINALSLVTTGIFGKGWEARKVREIMAKHRPGPPPDTPGDEGEPGDSPGGGGGPGPY